MRFLPLTLSALILAAAPLAQADTASKKSAAAITKIADVEVAITDSTLQKKDVGIRTLFFVIYDADSAMPMPFGAMKVTLDKDAKGVFYKGTLTSENVMAMSGGAPPKNMRIKARLDKDGSAGRDEPGDLTGVADHVTVGSSIKITVDKAI
jgi:hypothetical protein